MRATTGEKNSKTCTSTVYEAEGNDGEAEAAATAAPQPQLLAGNIPVTPIKPPDTPPALLGQIPAHLLPPTIPRLGAAQPKPSARPTSNVTQLACPQPAQLQQFQTTAAAPPQPPAATQQLHSSQAPPGIALPIGASLPNPVVAATAPQPACENPALNPPPPLGVAAAVPTIPAGPWAYTHQAYRGVQTPVVSVDVNQSP